MYSKWFLAILILAGTALTAGWALMEEPAPAEGEKGVRFVDARTQSRQFIEYYEQIQLGPEQEQVKKEALEALPASCCSDNSMLECCCPCNLSKTIWGLSNHLIAELKYDAAQVRETVLKWLEFINPNGFDGEACYTQRCATPFAQGGCGGMKSEQLIF